MALTIDKQIQCVIDGKLKSSTQAYYGPYDSLATAISDIKSSFTEATDSLSKGFTVGVNMTSGVKEYQVINDTLASVLVESSFVEKVPVELSTDKNTATLGNISIVKENSGNKITIGNITLEIVDI